MESGSAVNGLGAEPEWKSRSNRDFLRVVFGVDLLLCCVHVLIGAAVGFALVRGSGADEAPSPTALLAAQLAISAGIAVFGIAANRLLRQQRGLGVVLGRLTVAFAATGLALSAWEHTLRSAIPDDGEACDPAVALAGFILGISLRIGWNILYLVAISRVRRALQPSARHS